MYLGDCMNKNIFFLIRISLIMAMAGSFFGIVTSELQEEKPVVKARMSFIGGDENSQGILFQLADSGYISWEQIGSIGKGKKQSALYADMRVLEPLINKAYITVTKNTISACKAKLKDESYLTAMANYYGEDKEAVKQKLEAALDAFYAKIKGLSSRIDFDSVSPATEQAAVSVNASPVLQELFNFMSAHEIDTTIFIQGINQRNKVEEQANPFAVSKNPFLKPTTKPAKPVLDRKQLLSDWDSFLKQCSSKSSGATMGMPFVDLYENLGRVASPLVFIYNALIDLGKVFKFEMEPIAPRTLIGRAGQALEYTYGIGNWIAKRLRGSGSVEKKAESKTESK